MSTLTKIPVEFLPESSPTLQLRMAFTNEWLDAQAAIASAITGGYSVVVQINGEFHDVRIVP